MNGKQLRVVLTSVTTSLEEQSDEFRKLDAAVGDGDLGITVAASAAAVRDALSELPEGATVSDVVRAAAQAIATANPSTMSALTAGGLLRVAKETSEDPVDLADGLAAGRAFHDSVAAKGKSAPGDKTILDAIGPSLDALEEVVQRGGSTADALASAIVAAERGIGETTPLSSSKGRARWVGERSRGHPDPGAVLYLRFLEAWKSAIDK